MPRLSLKATLAVAAGSFLIGCEKMSESYLDESVGINGGFEVTRNGLPVNWLVYTPATIPTGDYDLVIDTVEYIEGRQSLKFVVRDCSPTGGWHSPGLSKEYEATTEVTYLVGLWVKSDGSRFRAKVGGVSAFQGEYETIVETGDSIPEWRHYEHRYTMPEGFDRLRLEINVLGPGTVWVDDITIAETSIDPTTVP